jgi:hypothetical protein
MILVKAVLGSGATAIVSSDGFSIDETPPIYDADVMSQIYVDVTQGEFTPVWYQASNSTIKAFWRCLDDESSIVVCCFFIRNRQFYFTPRIKMKN